MAKLAALLVLTVAAVLGLFQAPAAATGFVGQLVPDGPRAAPPEVVAEVLAASAGDVLLVPEPQAPVTPAATAPPNTTTTAPPTPAEEAAVLAPALQVAAGDPEPQPGRLEVLGAQELAGVVGSPAQSSVQAPVPMPARASPDGLAHTGASTDDLLALGIGLIALGSILCRRT